ncbi:XRE family transcriptional regulator [Clostridium thailandense]|uniref:XRE family transcriptional regulator n=1 Tax=Clostridium thailandense TaxID=2794346 RepID=UPI003989B3BF
MARTCLKDKNAIENKFKIDYRNELVKGLNTSTVGEKIKYHRLLKGWSQFELAKRLGLTEKQGRYLIKDYETRGLYPPPELSVKLARIFEIGTKYFYDDYYEFLDSNYSYTILNWRKNNNLTVAAAATKINVNYVTWSSWENGKKINRGNYNKLKILMQTCI